MLSSKQIKDLPKGKYSNLELHKIYPNHGLAKRTTVINVDKYGNQVSSLSSRNVGTKTVLLGRKQAII